MVLLLTGSVTAVVRERLPLPSPALLTPGPNVCQGNLSKEKLSGPCYIPVKRVKEIFLTYYVLLYKVKIYYNNVWSN